jgi:hypothetical protein
MANTQIKWIAAAISAMALIALSALPVLAAAQGNPEAPVQVKRIDFENSDPYQVRGKVMEVQAGKGTFVVAEREIREMDVVTENERLRTMYFDLAGKPEEKRAYRIGQFVFVKGYLTPEGYVAALEVRLIEKPQGKRLPYKPIANKARSSHGGRRGGGEPR